jgi:hypothetical protein
MPLAARRLRLEATDHRPARPRRAAAGIQLHRPQHDHRPGLALRRLVASRSGDWPGDRTVTVAVPAGTGNIYVSMVCADAIADRL